jgi:hypothetical protein
MRFLKISALFSTVALLVACTRAHYDFEEIEGPTVLSLDPNITVEKWVYLSPDELSQTDNPLVLPDNDGVAFGDDAHRALITWTEQGFDLYWGELPCATKPIVLIKENAVIELFGGKQPPPPTVCHAMESFHGFTVTLSSATSLPPASQWAYSFRPSER